MKKRTKMILAAALAAIVVLAIVLAFALGKNSGTTPPGSQSEEPPYSLALPESTIIPHNPQSKSEADDSIPYVGPIDSPIIGKWEYHPDYIDAYGVYYEFTPDGTLYKTQFHIEDADYPENWWVNTYNFHFDTWRGQEVLESGHFMGYMHHRVEFYELDGRQAMDIITIKDDGEEYISLTLLKLEE